MEGPGAPLTREGPGCSGCASWPWVACLAAQRASSRRMPLCFIAICGRPGGGPDGADRVSLGCQDAEQRSQAAG